MIRVATCDDTGMFAAIHTAVLKRGWNRNAFEAFYETGRVTAYSAHHDGQAAGYIFCWSVAGECELLNVAVLPEFHGKGYGRALCEAAMKDACETGDTTMHLEVATTNAPAVGLYKALGFAITRKRKDYYGPGEDALVMVLAF